MRPVGQAHRVLLVPEWALFFFRFHLREVWLCRSDDQSTLTPLARVNRTREPHAHLALDPVADSYS